VGGGIPRSWCARQEKTMLRTYAAAGVGEQVAGLAAWAQG